jgi:putative tryptophan/tyrosine transport system substrate-binding protein
MRRLGINQSHLDGRCAMVASRFAVASIVTLGVCLAALPVLAQPAARVARIGVLGNSDERRSSPEQLVEGLRALGWIEGQNLVIERRYLEGDIERAPRLAAELVGLNVDVIVAAAPPNVRAAQRATSSIPIVLTAVSDPVGMGFVASLARPGGNITGVTSAIPEGFLAKQLQLIKEALPTAARVGLLFNAANMLNYRMASAKQLAAAAQASNIELRDLEIRSAEDIERTMSADNLRGLDAVFIVGDPLTFRHRMRIHELATLQRMPTFVPTPEYVEGKALAAYGPSLRAQGRHAAAYVDKILKGAKAADLPVEQPREYRLIVNLRAARTLGLNLPSSLVMRADDVIQ